MKLSIIFNNFETIQKFKCSVFWESGGLLTMSPFNLKSSAHSSMKCLSKYSHSTREKQRIGQSRERLKARSEVTKSKTKSTSPRLVSGSHSGIIAAPKGLIPPLFQLFHPQNLHPYFWASFTLCLQLSW